MKRFACITSVIMVFAVSALAGEMTAGFKGGLNIAAISGDDVPDDASRLYAGAGGVFFGYELNDMFAVQPELLFMMKGFSIDAKDRTSDTKLDYIDIPVLLKVVLPTGNSFRPSLFTGPYLGILMRARDADKDAGDDTRSTDVGVIFGAGLDYLLAENEGFVSIDVRVGMGMTTTDGSDAGKDRKNMDITIMAGYGRSF